MKIAMFSMTPLFENQSMGGAQKQLKKVALHLAQQGHEVTILCTRRSDAMQPFRWHENLLVKPIFRFKQPFPEPYATPTYNIAAAIQDMGDELAQSDVFYNHDGGLIFPYIYQDIPAVISLRSIIFSETLQSGYLFQGDALILPSEHTANVWQHTAGRFFPDWGKRVHVIHNGLDFAQYQPTKPQRILDIIPVDPAKHRVVLYPHRPEAPKGILQTIAVADLLVNQYGMDDVRVLVPKWIDTGHSADVRQFYTDLEADIAQRGLAQNFIFHDWISDDLMPEFLSLGDVTLALGSYVETFGNVPYESLACGTPVIAANVGPYRDMLPPSLLVNYGDVESAAECAAQILQDRQGVPPEISAWLHENFQQADMVAAYAEVILNAKKLPPLHYKHQAITPPYQLAPWCGVTEHGVYHDFRAEYNHAPNFFHLEAASSEEIERWLEEGYLVPVQKKDSMSTVYLSLGSNEDAANNIVLGYRMLWQIGAIAAMSSVYESAAANGKDAAPYLNAVVALQTSHELDVLKGLLRRFEEILGRSRDHTSVPIDYDILFSSDRTVEYLHAGKTYSLPHADILNRAYVALPLAEIAPDWVHPIIGQTAQRIAEDLGDDGLTLRGDVRL
ncbi:MAG: 2-amino-4-hydroxy-6-hydroxymethyldihydropteridine diphosphokinase [Anaerolineae bacterium]|nr:2-amino-4-hydroxy-6-hydroxymethyldihydropteridine diphosphokinase [Anaerolineae bacterium]